MFCRICGTELRSGANYCTGCGSPVSPIPSPKPAGGHQTKTLIVLAAICALIAVVAVAVVFDDKSEPSVTRGDITARGGLVCDEISLIDDGLSYSGDGVPLWSYLDTSHPYLEKLASGYGVRSHTEVSDRDLRFTSPGVYDVVLAVDGSTEYRGKVIFDGTLNRTYSWNATIAGAERSFHVGLSYSLSEFLTYSDDGDAIRHSTSVRSDSRFVITDDAVLRFADVLKAEYQNVMGPDCSVSGQDYADYLLSFVQCCIAYPDTVSRSGSGFAADPDGSGDLYLYGSTEYWAYPIETIHRGSGDCEDTSFLLCSILSASGFDSALVTLPSHMMVAVELESFSPKNVVGGLELTVKKVDGHAFNIYFCETTYSRFVPAGYVSSSLHDDVMDVDKVLFIPKVTS